MIRRNLASQIIAIDPSPKLIEIAKARDYLANSSALKLIEGDVKFLSEIADSSFNLIIALNVLAYMDRSEEERFYQECQRILVSGGHILITHLNELFDIFTMNNLTIDFYKRHFQVEIGKFLDTSKLIPVQTYAIRENPLNYPAKLNGYGFSQEKIDFFITTQTCLGIQIFQQEIEFFLNTRKGLQVIHLNGRNTSCPQPSEYSLKNYETKSCEKCGWYGQLPWC